jgi:hypothetical protein
MRNIQAYWTNNIVPVDIQLNILHFVNANSIITITRHGTVKEAPYSKLVFVLSQWHGPLLFNHQNVNENLEIYKSNFVPSFSNKPERMRNKKKN